jgi:hypothetical protein
MVSPTSAASASASGSGSEGQAEGVPIPKPETTPRRRGSRVLQSSLEIAFSCQSRDSVPYDGDADK